MKIKDIYLFQIKGKRKAPNFPPGHRQCQQLDIYPEFNDSPINELSGDRDNNSSRETTADREKSLQEISGIYLEIKTENPISGIYGPISRRQAFIIKDSLTSFLKGKDPLATKKLWDQMMRKDRHGRSGAFMTAISAIDCALWDLKGKAWDKPIYRLLGGPVREEIPAYASMLGFSIEPEAAAEMAAAYKEKGFTAQKWFFRFGPADGSRGREKNIEMVAAVREAVGKQYPLMFDAFMGWDVDYAIKMVQAIEKYNPTWVEEPIPPERIGSLKKIKNSSRVPIATGEHVYTRWQAKELLENKAVDILQTDPDWTGGISELVEIASLASAFGTTLIPHGHSLLPALQVAGSRPQTVIPRVEYLIRHQENKQYFHKPTYRPRQGSLRLPQLSGLGLQLDQDNITSCQELSF